MAKFKIGDKVIAKKDAPYNVTTNGWKGVVTGINIFNDDITVIGSGDSGKVGFHVKSEFFDLDTSCNQKIVITSDGKTTLARLYQNNSVVKTAEVKCSPDDEFDFEQGANLAFSRLIGLELVVVEETTSFKKGDRVRITANTNYHQFPIGSVVTIIDDSLTGDNAHWCKGIDNYSKNDCWYVRESDTVKVDDELDWDAFKAGKIAVKVTEDNFKEFVSEAKEHECTFYDEDFNPFKNICHVIYCMICSYIKKNEIYVVYENGNLKVQHELCDLEEFVW